MLAINRFPTHYHIQFILTYGDHCSPMIDTNLLSIFATYCFAFHVVKCVSLNHFYTGVESDALRVETQVTFLNFDQVKNHLNIS